jgi:uncharacterized protein
MPGGWSKVRDVSRLAETRAEFDFDIPVAELPGIPSDVAEAGGTVRALVRFERDQGFAVAEIEVHGAAQAVCQRCMRPMTLPVHARSRVAVVESDVGADGVPPGWDTYLAPDAQLELAALVAEEVLLALPIVALHEQDDCASGASAAERQDEAAPEERTRPFADLRALLDRDSSK